MSLAVNDEWSALAARWQDRSEPLRITPDALLRQEQRRRIGMVLLVGIEVLISLAGLAGAWVARERMDSPAGTLILVVVTVYTAMMWTFALWNRWGTWRPERETVEGFLAVNALRCRRGLRTARFVIGVVVVQLLVSLAWAGSAMVRAGGPAGPSALRGLVLALLIGGGYLVWAAWYRRRMRQKLAWLSRWSPEIVGQGGRA